MTTRREFVLGASALITATTSIGQGTERLDAAEKSLHKPLVRRLSSDTPPPPATGSLADLPPNTARDLGTFVWRDATDPNITDYSGLVYDPAGRRDLIFGGGHGPYQWTDIRAYDLTTLQWSSLYPPTPRSEMTLANGDSSFGRWISTNQPYARHSYNMSVVVGRRFYLMMQLGLPDHLDGPAPPWGGRICWYDFNTRAWSYSRNSSAETPWYYASAAALDPVTQLIVIVGPNSQGGTGNLWLYDPATDSISVGPPLPDIGYALDLVYFPPSGKFYAMQADGRAWEIALGRANISASTITPVAITGSPPPVSGACGFAYDSNSRIIGGNVINGTFHAFDPVSRAWSMTKMQTLPGAQSVPNQAFHCLDFDPVSGCFIFLSDPATSSRTWAYRYRARG